MWVSYPARSPTETIGRSFTFLHPFISGRMLRMRSVPDLFEGSLWTDLRTAVLQIAMPGGFLAAFWLGLAIKPSEAVTIAGYGMGLVGGFTALVVLMGHLLAPILG
jgi:hypothetical protein